MKIILAGPYPAGTEEKFGQLLPGDEIVTVTDQAEYEAMTEGDVIVVRVLKTPASVLAPKKDLKAVIRWGPDMTPSISRQLENRVFSWRICRGSTLTQLRNLQLDS